ncbi:MAG: deoxyguanosinetriphosphate triphosphohydrolase [Hyphomicrobiaceae bacterium]
MQLSCGEIHSSTANFGADLAPGQRLLAPYAASATPSRGRLHHEDECPTRSPFQRDRDRIIHSTPFRRLTHKTQVFLYHEGDHYRTRLTHSLEVAQIARTIARQLCLDEDLSEVLALAHDLGHPPFGHAGERALAHALEGVGGFDHNAQSMRIVTALERKYMSFDGLNLTWESLEGLAKHNGPIRDIKHNAVVKVGRDIDAWCCLNYHQQASAEAQVAALADDIAYLNHDIDDGLRAGLLTLADLKQAPLAGSVVARLEVPTTDEMAKIGYSISRSLITDMIFDCVAESRRRLRSLAPRSPDAIREAGHAVIGFGDAMAANLAALKTFLFAKVYRHNRVMQVMGRAEVVVAQLVERYRDDPTALDPAWRKAAQGLSDRQMQRMIGDFVAGMTDRYAIEEHQRLFDATPELR